MTEKIEVPPDPNDDGCPFLHECAHLYGWEVESVERWGSVYNRHIVPCGDLRPHRLSEFCWCGPTEIEEDLWSHRSLDGRERHVPS